jgi:hypothetical protein
MKWEYLEHHGVTFPDPYTPKRLSVTYSGERIPYSIPHPVSTPTRRN